MSGFIQGYVMRTMLQATKLAAAALILATTASVASAVVPPPVQVTLVGGKAIQQKDGRLYEVDPIAHKVSPIHVPAVIERKLKASLSVVFPDDHSRLIDKKEYVLVVVNHSSSSNPAGYCGSGEEGTLYVFELNGDEAVSRFSVPVRSCLKDYDLANNSGQASEYRAIEWKDAPVGIQIRWDVYGDASDVSHFYSFQNGQFRDAAK
ncbi:hypothetical protein [Paraburkholderia phosphatilytica]|uniref:hypothetical protein n=1 Tax=Paraburkholderia phosphatilytica TaxID=2282883 RepID=UPI000F5F6CC3|nr:hypothetical protein [Paraburkholderia phosphatilytica]